MGETLIHPNPEKLSAIYGRLRYRNKDRSFSAPGDREQTILRSWTVPSLAQGWKCRNWKKSKDNRSRTPAVEYLCEQPPDVQEPMCSGCTSFIQILPRFWSGYKIFKKPVSRFHRPKNWKPWSGRNWGARIQPACTRGAAQLERSPTRLRDPSSIDQRALLHVFVQVQQRPQDW